MDTSIASNWISFIALVISAITFIWTRVDRHNANKHQLNMKGFTDWCEQPEYSNDPTYSPDPIFVIQITYKSKVEVWYGKSYIQYHDMKIDYLTINSDGMTSIKPGEQKRLKYPIEIVDGNSYLANFDSNNYRIMVEDSFGKKLTSVMINQQ